LGISLAALVIVLSIWPLPVYADGPVYSDEGKLFGMKLVTGGPDADDWGPSEEVLFSLYEKSGATAAWVRVSWGDCEPNDPGNDTSKYDFSSFDKQLFLRSTKTKICSIELLNQWADKIKEKDPERYWKLAEAFVTAFAKHANSKGVKYFYVAGKECDMLGRADWAQLYVEQMKHIYTAVKAVSKHNVVIAGNLSHGSDDLVQALYDAGAKGYFDVLSLHAYSNDPKTGVDIFQVVAVHRAMVRNGDGDKKIYISEGWGPGRAVPGISRKSHEEPPSEAEIEAIRGFVENGYRNMLTERDIYDPKWLLGAQFLTMNDNYGRRKWKERAEKVDENGDGEPDYVLLDGHKFPSGFDIEPVFFNGGLVTFEGKPKGDLLDDFLPKIPDHKIEGQLVADSPTFNYITDKPYKYSITFTNLTQKEIAIEKFDVSWRAEDKINIETKPEGDMPKSVAVGGSATANFVVTFPKEAAGRQITLIGECSYSIEGRKHFTDCWNTVLVTSQLEVTLLPGRLIMDGNEAKRVGISVINHMESPFEGKITFTATPGIRVAPVEVDTKIDSYGLEAYVFSVSADKKLAPGHYVVNIDIGGKVKDWMMVDVPAVARKLTVRTDGKLDEWESASAFALAKPIIDADGKTSYEFIGKGWFAYSDSGFYAAFEVDDSKHVQTRDPADMWQEDSVQLAFDPLMNGARTRAGGYMVDDYEYTFAQTSEGPMVYRSKAGASKPLGVVRNVRLAFKHESGKSFYEIGLPWSELEPFKPEKGKVLGASVLINRSEGAGRSWVEWGGGVAEKKDPRLFVPVILAE